MQAETEDRIVEDLIERTERWRKVRLALEKSREGGSPRHQEQRLELDIEGFPRYPTGLINSDGEEFYFQGLNVIGGESGTGKSILALQVSMYLAEMGYLVHYHDAENGAGLTRTRVRRWYGRKEFTSRFSERVSGQGFRYAEFLPGHSLNNIISTSVEFLPKAGQDYQGVVIVLDSADAMARIMDDSSDLKIKNRLFRWANQISRSTNGFVSTVLLSECNIRGEIRGSTPVYTSNVALEIHGEPDLGEDIVNVYVRKYRDGKSRYEFGKFIRHWQGNQFLPFHGHMPCQPMK